MAMTISVALLALAVFSAVVGWVISRQWPSTNEIARRQGIDPAPREARQRRYEPVQDVRGQARNVIRDQQRQ